MRASGKSILSPALVALALGALAACSLDLGGLPGGAATSAATGGGAPASTTSSSSGGGSGGEGGSHGPRCGNHVVESGEACDDGNTELGDGCSPDCAKEPLDACPGLPIALTPPGIVIHGTLEGALDELAPSAKCAANGVDVVYAVTPTVSGSLRISVDGAGEKSVSLRTSCLDSPIAEIGCQHGTGGLALTPWVYAGVTYYVVVDAVAPEVPAFSLHLALGGCGDGKVQAPEECDDVNDKTCVGCFRCGGAGETFDPASRHCYRRITGKSWQGARAECLAWGGDLAGVSSAAENEFLKSRYSGDLWTGATDLINECSFQWVNGEPWQPHWHAGEPNDYQTGEDCGTYSAGEMNDDGCDKAHDALCERAPGGGCGDGVLQPGEECDDGLEYDHLTCAKCVLSCPAGEIKDPATHHCYRFEPSPLWNWDGAAAQCALTGAYLAAINTPLEDALLLPYATAPMWIGGRAGASFPWSNTDALCYSNWSSAPSTDAVKNCVTLQTDGHWSTDLCITPKGYVCERDN